MRQSADRRGFDALLELVGPLVTFGKVSDILDKSLCDGIDVYVVSRDLGSDVLDVGKLGAARRAVG
jgi:hypothetical protein